MPWVSAIVLLPLLGALSMLAVPPAPAGSLQARIHALVTAGGMVFGLYQFINNGNGSNSEFGEADATNPKLGFVGLGTAFAGGMLMLMGHKANNATKMPSLTFGRHGVGVAKRISW